jgi:hypothetical protein
MGSLIELVSAIRWRCEVIADRPRCGPNLARHNLNLSPCGGINNATGLLDDNRCLRADTLSEVGNPVNWALPKDSRHQRYNGSHNCDDPFSHFTSPYLGRTTQAHI